MTLRRLLAATTTLVVVLAGCASVEEAVDELGDDVVTTGESPAPAVPGETSPPAATDGEPAPATPPPSSATTDPGPPPAEPPAEQTQTSLTPVDDDGGLGANGPAILRGDRPRLVIEVDVQEGAAVSDAALGHLVDELGRHVDKAEITFAGGGTFASDDTSWTVDELRAAVADNRETASDDQQVSIHVLVVRGANERDGETTSAIGLAYAASTFALFPEQAQGLGSLVGSTDAVTRAVLVHEAGHLLGLVNLTYTSPIDHEDPEHPNHSSSEGSVMFHAVETTLVGQVFGGAPPDRFDEADAADLAGLKSGELGR